MTPLSSSRYRCPWSNTGHRQWTPLCSAIQLWMTAARLWMKRSPTFPYSRDRRRSTFISPRRKTKLTRPSQGWAISYNDQACYRECLVQIGDSVSFIFVILRRLRSVVGIARARNLSGTLYPLNAARFVLSVLPFRRFYVLTFFLCTTHIHRTPWLEPVFSLSSFSTLRTLIIHPHAFSVQYPSPPICICIFMSKPIHISVYPYLIYMSAY